MSPGPWRFHQYLYGFSHVICDADGRIIASSVIAHDGPLMAAAPALLHALRQIAAIEGPAQDIAARTVEDFGEREGFILADWDPHRPRPRLRIIGEAT
jgi:hypothetical protein